MKAATVLLLVASFTAAVSASRLRRPRSHGLGVANPIDLLSLLELDPKTSEIVTDHMNSIKGRETVPAEKSRAVRENRQNTKEISSQEIMSASKTTEFQALPQPDRVSFACALAEKSPMSKSMWTLKRCCGGSRCRPSSRTQRPDKQPH